MAKKLNKKQYMRSDTDSKNTYSFTYQMHLEFTADSKVSTRLFFWVEEPTQMFKVPLDCLHIKPASHGWYTPTWEEKKKLLYARSNNK